MSMTRLGKYACLEVERRYLLRALPTALVGRPPYRHVVDHYLPQSRLRLRLMQSPDGTETVWKLGQKFRASGQSPTEATITNIYLDEAEYHLLRGLGGQEIGKDRYVLPYQGRRYGIDVFRDALQGLILAEVECETLEDALQLAVPPFAIADVTDDERFTGGHLASLSADGLRHLLPL
jgi:CYTH domain-containing protein